MGLASKVITFLDTESNLKHVYCCKLWNPSKYSVCWHKIHILFTFISGIHIKQNLCHIFRQQNVINSSLTFIQNSFENHRYFHWNPPFHVASLQGCKNPETFLTPNSWLINLPKTLLGTTFDSGIYSWNILNLKIY